MKKIIVIICLVLIMLYYIKKEPTLSFEINDYQYQITNNTYVRKFGKVDNKKDALIIAKEVFEIIYGKSSLIKKYEMYNSKNNEHYMITGILPKNKLGGVPYIIINKKDGNIMAVWHDK